MAAVAVQDLLDPDRNTCYGCGPHNREGLRLKSYWQDDCINEGKRGEELGDGSLGSCRASFLAKPHMNGGSPEITYGGIIASIVDCHGINTARAFITRSQGLVLGESSGSAPQIWCVTKSLRVDYRRPTPVGIPIELTARVTKTEKKNRIIHVKIKVESVDSKGTYCSVDIGHSQ
uniref:Thioesterase domain-containing protein n=1 Tax=Lotharella globosa TaxID=91324 RepID=A0A7S3Z2S0_9EUKA